MNRRLVTSRLCAGIISAIALLTSHAWSEHGALDDVLGAIGLLLLLVACIGRIWCASYVAGRKDRELVDKGPFSITRNPLYFFSFFFAIFVFIVIVFFFVAIFIFILFVFIFFVVVSTFNATFDVDCIFVVVYCAFVFGKICLSIVVRTFRSYQIFTGF